MLTIEVSIFFLTVGFFSCWSLGVSRAWLTGGTSTHSKDSDQKCNGSNSFHFYKVKLLKVPPTLSEDNQLLD